MSLAAVIVLAASYAAAGESGLLAITGLAALAALLTARLKIPGASRPAPGSAPARFRNPAFPRYRQIHVALGEAQVSQRHFDMITRPLLQRLLAALVADRHGADMSSDVTAAREALGGDVWPLLDPARPASADSSAPGVSLDTLAAIVERLEDM